MGSIVILTSCHSAYLQPNNSPSTACAHTQVELNSFCVCQVIPERSVNQYGNMIKKNRKL